MPGKLVPILCKRHFDFTAVAGGASQDIVLVADIDTASYVYAGIFVRVHARNMTAGQSLDFSLYNTLPTEADHREFVETDGAGSPSALVTVTVTSASPAAGATSTSSLIRLFFMTGSRTRQNRSLRVSLYA